MPLVSDPEPMRNLGDLELGDPTARLTLEIYREPFDRWAVHGWAAVKAPVTDADEGLGSGEWDTGAGARWSRRAGSGRLRLDAGWWRLGDPEGLELKDAVTVEVSWTGAGRTALDLALHGRSEVVAGAGEVAVASCGLLRWIGQGRLLYAAVDGGLTDAAPDLAARVGVRIGFGG